MSNIDFLNISQKDFEVLLDKYSDEYHNGIASISDELFDSLKDIYEKRFNKKYSKIGYAVNHKNKVKLPFCMPSLGKVLTENEIYNWLSRFPNEKKFVISDKIDGISLLLCISNGNVKLFTRGDGTEGRDVSYFIPYIDFGNKNIINNLKNQTIFIRGELVLPTEKFEKKYKGTFSNPRNTVSGAIVAKEFNIGIIRDCKFLAYEIYYSDFNKTDKTRLEHFDILTKLQFNTPFYFEVNKQDINFSKLEDFIKKRRKVAEYEMDGIVISTSTVLENKTEKKICEDPKDYIAFKIKGDTIEATVEYVEWNLSKNGIYKPRIKIYPVNLSGVTINYTTGFNARFIPALADVTACIIPTLFTVSIPIPNLFT
jgi:NAD-dependent DNA ligase